jgi:GEVED domain/Secretion system C-terminal sorting domain/SprB repeat
MKKLLFLTSLSFLLIFSKSQAQLSVNIDTIIDIQNCTPGQINFTAFGGTAPYEAYAYDTTIGFVGVTGFFSSSSSILITAPGNYMLVVLDTLGISDTSMVTVSGSNVFSASMTITPISPGTNTVLATGIATGGVSPYTYFWSPTSGVANTSGSTTIINLFSGTSSTCYTLTVTDANGCVFNTASCINSTFIFMNTSAQTTSDCGTGNGSIILTTTGGTPPYTYSMNGSAFVGTSLAAGSYTITTLDSNGLSATVTVIIPLTSPSVSIYAPSTPCGNNNGGSLKATAVGMTSFLWNSIPAQTTDSAIGLNPGIYQVTASNGQGCSATATYNLQQIDLTVTAARDSICAGDSTLLTASASGSLNNISPLPMGYAVSSATFAADEDIIGVTIGSFNNTSNCGTTGGPAANGLPASLQSLYSNYSAITMPFYAIGGNVPYSIRLSNCSSVAFTGQLAIFIDFNHDGILSTAEKVGGTTIPQVIPVSPQFIDITGTFSIPSSALSGTTLMRIICIESNTTLVQSSGTYNWGETEDYAINIGNAPPQSITWYSTPITAFNNNLNAIVNPNLNTIYTVVCNDAKICIDSASVSVVIKDGLSANYTATTVHTNTDCPLGSNGALSVVSSPIANNFSFVWNNTATTSAISNLTVGNYNVLVTDSLGGCVKLYDTIISSGTNCGDVLGSVIWDSSKNCVFDAGEPGIANTMITVNPGNHITYTDASGNYAINGLPYNTYTVTKSNNVPGFVSSCGVSTASSALTTAMPSFTQVFLDSSNLIFDYSISGWGNCIAPALGQLSRTMYFHHNKAGITQTATIYAVFDSILLFGSSIPAPTAINGDTVKWNVIIGGNQGTIIVDFNFPLSQQNGYFFDVDFGIMNTLSTDTNLYNNFITRTFETCTSYDPNDKNVAPAGKTAQGYLPLDSNRSAYTVRFQNTGNFTAGKVVIMDTLSPLLDINDFQIEAASHTYQLEVINNHILKISFLNIMLPDSGSDLEGSKGFVSFNIKHKNTIAGAVLENTAAIYFDYNAQVITNTTTNTFFGPLSGNTIANANSKCAGICGNGSAIVTNNGGVAPFVHTITPMCSATTITNNQIANLGGGIYTINSTDAIGNTATQLLNITSTTSGINITNTSITQISGTTLGSASFSAASGVAPYTYLWTPGNMTTDAVQNLAPGTYTCITTDANGCTASALFTINTPTGLVDLDPKNRLHIYPNPASNMLTLECISGFESARISNILGTVVYNFPATIVQKVDLDISQWSNGVYQVQMGNGVVKRFVVKH